MKQRIEIRKAVIIMINRSGQWALGFIAALSAFYAFANESEKIVGALETELSKIQSDLQNIQSGIESALKLESTPGLGPQTEEASLAFETARVYFAREDYLSTIRELNRFLNLTQNIPSPDYLRAQLILGKSYQMRGQNVRAARCYMRYLAAFVTNDSLWKANEILDVLQNLIAVVGKTTEFTKRELGQLISSLATVDFPDHVRPEFLYLSSKAAQRLGENFLTSNWLRDSRSVEEGEHKSIESRVLYYQGLLEVNAGNYQQANSLLNELLMRTPSRAYHDAARLALARVAVKQQKPHSALSYYDSIPSASPHYRDALLESIFVAVAIEKNEIALSKAKEFLEKYPGGKDGFEVRSVLASLEINADRLSQAKASIDSNIQNLTRIVAELKLRYTARQSLNYDDLFDIYELTNGFARHPEMVVNGMKTFAQIEELRSQSAEIRGDSQNIVYMMGRATIGTLNPNRAHAFDQLYKYSQRLMESGNLLSFVLRESYKSEVSEILRSSWETSDKRRKKLFLNSSMKDREFFHWADTANYARLTTDLEAQFRRIQKQLASLAAVEVAMMKRDVTKIGDLENQRSKMVSIQKSIMRTLQSIRQEQIRNTVRLNRHQADKRLFALYMSNLLDEKQIFQNVGDSLTTPLERLTFDQAIQIWRKVENVSKIVFDRYAQLEAMSRKDIASSLVATERAEAKATDIIDQLNSYEDMLAKQLGESAATIVNHYMSELNILLARYRKWSGDIDFVEFEKVQNKKTDSQKKYELQKQILSDQLQDLKQGVIWQ